MQITREIDHAVKCVLYLSMNQLEYISVSELSVRVSVPKSFLAKIFQKLAKSGIIESLQGKQGGFRLAKKPEDITLYDVFEALHSLPIVNKCVDDDAFCQKKAYCSIHPVWEGMQNDIVNRLKKTRFIDLGKKEFDTLHKLVQTPPEHATTSYSTKKER